MAHRPGPLNTLAASIHAHNVDAGWWDESHRHYGSISDPSNYGKGAPVSDKYLIPTKLALVHSEISEALEGFRKNLMDDHLPQHSMFSVELGDALIRIFDVAGYYDIDLDTVVAEKRAYNASRADHTREARSAPGGKSV